VDLRKSARGCMGVIVPVIVVAVQVEKQNEESEARIKRC
jgi:hypothetical protein